MFDGVSHFFGVLQEMLLSFVREEMYLFLGRVDFSVITPMQAILDIGFLFIIFWAILELVTGTRAAQILMGVLIIAILYVVANSLNLVGLKTLLQTAFTVFIVAIPVVFQPELRKGLEQLGKASFFSTHLAHSKSHRVIKEVKKAAESLARKRHGALIVIEQNVPLTEYIETGLSIDGTISKELVQSIFYPKSPLHDGAIIIRGEKIMSASSVLPLSHEIHGHFLGTRHRSALGLSEVTDAIVVVISEERGEISIAHEGRMQRSLTGEQLEQRLQKYMNFEKKKKK